MLKKEFAEILQAVFQPAIDLVEEIENEEEKCRCECKEKLNDTEFENLDFATLSKNEKTFAFSIIKSDNAGQIFVDFISEIESIMRSTDLIKTLLDHDIDAIKVLNCVLNDILTVNESNFKVTFSK